MTLQAGARLGPYEILAHAGSGGMGEVYKARDSRLDRLVAIKVLPPHVLDDPAVRARFEREARAASSLDHPNICVLHDVGREGAVEYLVMQYLDGETLARRLARGPLSIQEALRYAADIAGALDRAHRAGILHRDIKPGNVMLVKAAGRDTSAKLLDFGLAKAVSVVSGDPSPATVATATSPLTGRGTIVGTMPYMSPEQLEGRELDARSDVFSFGAMLYEMVTGRRAFEGGSEASLIAAILDRDPPSMSSVAPLTPPVLDRLVRKCLAKDRDRRWQSAADLGDELTWIAQSSSVQQPIMPRSRGKASGLLWPALAALATAGFVAAIAWPVLRARPETPAAIARELGIALPNGVVAARGGVAVSPDGRTIVLVGAPAPGPGEPASSIGGPRRLYLRRFNSPDLTPIPGTAGARTPFFSPDGQSIGYLTGTALMTVSLRGGPPARVSSTPPVTRGGVWLLDDTLAVCPTQTSGLVRITRDGKLTPLTTVNTAQGERVHQWPSLLPGGDILFAVGRGTTSNVDASDVAVANAVTGEHRIVYRGASFPRYSPTGHLLVVRGGTLHAVPFDLASKRTTGEAVPIAEHVTVDPYVGGAHYAVTPDGALVFLRGAFPVNKASGVWVDPSGKSSPAAGIKGEVQQPRISPDGTRALFSGRSPDGDEEIYVADLARGTAVRLSADPQDDFTAIWTRDGRHAIWTALPPNRLPLLIMAAIDGSGGPEPLFQEPGVAQFAGSVSPSNVLAYTKATPTGGRDIWVMALDDRRPRPFVATSAFEISPEFSPNGKWIAYVSRESGESDIYVAPYPGPGGIRRVTSGGAISPAWSRDGRTLFYQADEGFMAVSVTGDADLRFGAPRRLFDGTRFLTDSRDDGPRAYDVSPDGKRFLMLVSETTPVPPPAVQVLLNWVGELKR
jgi:serine/threonine-protein kinase